jgi:glycosyltransferase involved in cell wall biosynthesis
MRSLRIAHLTNCLQIGGTERSILNLCCHSHPNQFVVSPWDGPIRPLFEASGIEVRVAPPGEALAACLSDASVVNIHWCTYIPHLFAAVVEASKPMVCTLQWLSELPPLPGPVICASQHVGDLQRNNRDRLMVVTNGIDTELFSPNPHPSDRVRIIRVCRPAKCDDYFWPAIMQVFEACPEADLTVVGGPPFSSTRVRGLGYRNDVHLLLRAADLFAYAPRPREGAFDLVLLEAMASGLPCVVTDVPCVSEGVEDELTGVLVPHGDVHAFASALIRLVRDAGLRRRMGETAVQAARSKFDIRDRIPLYEAAYERAYAEQTLPSERGLWRHQILRDPLLPRVGLP